MAREFIDLDEKDAVPAEQMRSQNFPLSYFLSSNTV